MAPEDINRLLGDLAPAVTTDVPELGVRVHVATRPAPPAPVIFEPMLYLVFQGAKRILLHTGEISYGPGELVTTAVHLPALAEVVTASAAAPYRALEIPFDHQLVTELLVELGDPPSAPAEAVAVHPLPGPVLDPVFRLLSLANDAGAARVLSRGVRREIWYRVLTGPNGGAFIELTRSRSALARVHELTEWMHQHLGEPIEINRVAARAHVSVTSLYRLFRAATGASPGAYHKRLRLMEARRRVAERSGTIQEIAASVGYASASQFTRDYRRAFGMPPTADFSPARAS